MKLGLRSLVFFGVAYVTGASLFATLGFHMMNESNTFLTICGLMILTGIVIGTLGLLVPFIRLCRSAIADSKGIIREMHLGRRISF